MTDFNDIHWFKRRKKKEEKKEEKKEKLKLEQMKFNWGTGIVIGIIAFMVFILQYVIRVQLDARYDNELVTEQYYQKETEIAIL